MSITRIHKYSNSLSLTLYFNIIALKSENADFPTRIVNNVNYVITMLSFKGAIAHLFENGQFSVLMDQNKSLH